MPARRSEILRLLDKLEGPLAKAFRDAVAKIRSQARIDRLAAAIQAGDIEAAMAAVGFRAGTWSGLTEAIRTAYVEAGVFLMGRNVPARFGAAFDINNPRAERWLRQHSSQLVTLITAEQLDAIQHVLRQGLILGDNPRRTALNIVGRVSPQLGRRAGGVLGLNGPQTLAALNAREQLQNLDPAYFNRARRDRRFDSLVRKAIESGKPLDQATINRLLARYEDRLLELRGTTIARTESLSALNEASDESLRQVVQEGLAPPDAVLRIWDSAGDSRTRPSHVAMEGQQRGLDEPFRSGNGALLMHPGDTSHGAGPGDIINCRCVVKHRIDFIAVEEAA